MKQFIFEEVTQAQVDTLIARLKKQGNVQLQGSVYVIDAHSIKATATFANDTLTVNVSHAPFWLPLGAIEDGIEKILGIGRHAPREAISVEPVPVVEKVPVIEPVPVVEKVPVIEPVQVDEKVDENVSVLEDIKDNE